MAVERLEEFVLDLGDSVKSYLTTFTSMSQGIRARQESKFQQMIIDNDLSYQQQFDYRQSQLEEEQDKIYPDNDYISALKEQTSSLKNLVRQRKYRDQYAALLNEMVSGRKGLTDQIGWLESQLQSGEWSREMKDQIEQSLQTAKQSKLDMDNKITQSQIDFYEKDKTAVSLSKALTLAQDGLSKATLANNQDLINQYQLEVQAINKATRETEVEDKVIFLAKQIISQDRPNESLYKLDSLLSYSGSGSADTPITIDGVRYTSEKDFWNQSVGVYIRSDFAKEYLQEEINKFAPVYNQTGVLPTSSIQAIVNDIKNLSGRSELAPYQTELNIISANVLNEVAKTKIQEVTDKYSLGTDISTTTDYQNALNEYRSLQSTFGNLYSLQSEIMKTETGLAEKKLGVAEVIAKTAEERGIGLPEAAAVTKEFSKEELLTKTPSEVAGVMLTGKEAPATPTTPTAPTTPAAKPASGLTIQEVSQRSGIPVDQLKTKGVQLTPAQQAELDKLYPAAAPVAPTTPTTAPTIPVTPVTPEKPATAVYSGSSIVDYLKSVGQASDYTTRSSIAKQKGITNYTGTAQQNLQLLKALRGF